VDNNEFTTTDNTSNTFIHPIECGTTETPLSVLYVQASNTSGGTDDNRFNDVGIFQISTIGQIDAAGMPIGELWCTYDIEFLKPALPDVHAGTSFLCNAPAAGESLTTTTLFDNGVEYDQENSYPVVPSAGGGGIQRLQLPVGYAGRYLATWQIAFSTAYVTGSALAPGPTDVGSDVTLGSIITPFVNSNSGSIAQFATGNVYQSAVAVANYNDGQNHVSGYGWSGSFIFSTIAETVANNYIDLQHPVWPQGGTAVYSLLITAVDNDVPSGKYAVTPAAQLLNRRARLALKTAESLKVSALTGETSKLTERLARLEAMLLLRSGEGVDPPSSSVRAPRSAPAPPVLLRGGLPVNGDITPVELDSPDETKEADLQKSVRISGSMAARLAHVLTGK
jgi:hypothetical protein